MRPKLNNFCCFGKVVFSRYYSMHSYNSVKVTINQGTVVGKQQTLPNGTTYYSFQGIPYAIPPLGELRFKSPIPLKHFNSPELDCTNERSVCTHRDPFTREVVGSEDCLFLNIFKSETNDKELLPVMVWIHGGGFSFGSGNSDMFLPLNLLQENVIVVTLNYRLRALGFLYLPDQRIWGNAGLKDQRLALRWVSENISRFGGDANNITLFGESAGAASVHLHAYAAHSNKLFHKIIMQSGSANMEWVFQSNSIFKTHRLAELLGYSRKSDAKSVLEYLQSPNITTKLLIDNTLKVLTDDERRRGLPLPFRPVVEPAASPDSFLNEPVLTLLQRPNSLLIPAIMGYNSSEGMAMLVNAVKKLPHIDQDLARFVPRNIPYSPDDPVIQVVANKMRKFYFQGRTINSKVFAAIVNMLSDYHFVVDLQHAVEMHAQHQSLSKLYFYRFDYVGERNKYKHLFQFDKLPGACHGDELFYLFQSEGDESNYKHDDLKVTKRLSRMWANFARESDPTPMQDKLINFKWHPVNYTKQAQDKFALHYLSIDKKCCLQQNPDEERIDFWRQIYATHKKLDYSISSKL